MEDWLKCQVGTLVKYRQNQNTKDESRTDVCLASDAHLTNTFQQTKQQRWRRRQREQNEIKTRNRNHSLLGLWRTLNTIRSEVTCGSNTDSLR